jgi:hypothetical protein
MHAGRGGRGGFGRDNWADKRDGQSSQKAGERFNKDARSRFAGGRGGRGGGRGFDSWRDKPQRIRYELLIAHLYQHGYAAFARMFLFIMQNRHLRMFPTCVLLFNLRDQTSSLSLSIVSKHRCSKSTSVTCLHLYEITSYTYCVLRLGPFIWRSRLAFSLQW